MLNAQSLSQAEREAGAAVQAALQSLRQLAGWGERVLGHSGALKSLSSKTADKDVKRSQMRKKCKPQMMNGF